MIIYCLAFLYLTGAYADWLSTCSDIRNGLAPDELKIDCFKYVVENHPMSCYCIHLTKQDSMRCTHSPDYENVELCDPMYELIYDIRDNKASDIFKDCEKQITLVDKPKVYMNNGNITHGAYANVTKVLLNTIQDIDTGSTTKVDINKKVKFDADHDLGVVVKGSPSILFELKCCANKMVSGCKVSSDTNLAFFRLVNTKHKCKPIENKDPFSADHVSNVLPLNISQLTNGAVGYYLLVTKKCDDFLYTITNLTPDPDSSYYSRHLPSIEEISQTRKWENKVDDWESSITCKKDDCKVIVNQLRCCSNQNVIGCSVNYYDSNGYYLTNTTISVPPPSNISYLDISPPNGKDNWGKLYAWWDTRGDTSQILSATDFVWKNTINTGVCYNGAFMAGLGKATVKVWTCNANQRDLDHIKEMMYEYIGYGIFGFKVNHGGAISRYELYDFKESEIPFGYLDEDQNIICDKEKKWNNAQAKYILQTTVNAKNAQSPVTYD